MAGVSSDRGSDYLCLREEPQWKNHIENYGYYTRVEGIVYYLTRNDSSLFSTVNTGGRQLNLNPVPCAVCYVPQRSTSVMMSASTSCPVGWTQEYAGYSMAYSDSNFICIDQAPEVANGGSSMYPVSMVRVSCGGLPCSSYRNYWELACVVCTK